MAAPLKLRCGHFVHERDGPLTQVSVVPPSEHVSTPRPIHLIFIVDVSGSMGSGVSVASDSGSKEQHGFTILDLVKHSLLTILEAIPKNTFVTLVAFTDTSQIHFKMLQMDADGKKKAKDVIMALSPLSTTNLWAGLKDGLDIIKQVSTGTCSTTPTVAAPAHEPEAEAGPDLHPKLARNEMLVFTDGLPNNAPSRGHVNTLIKYINANDIDVGTFTIRTYGFGYSLDSMLLEEIATVGRGTFNFIPDAQFVGTIFIHSLASILSQVEGIMDLCLHWDGAGEMIGYERFVTKDGGTRSIALGSGMEMQQDRDFIIRGSPEKVWLTYRLEKAAAGASDDRRVETVIQKNVFQEIGLHSDGLLKFQHAMLRVSMCEILWSKALDDGKAFGTEVQFGGGRVPVAGTHEDKLAEVFADFNAFVVREKQELSNNPNCEPLFQDLEGQVQEALSKFNWFKKWGIFYLRSLIFAHLTQRRNNFKDFGVQVYGGSFFDSKVETISDCFDNLPPPPPSGQTSFSTSAPAAPVSMATYNNCAGPCWGKGTLVKTVDPGSGVDVWKPVEQLRKGDFVRTGMKNQIGTVRCLVESHSVSTGKEFHNGFTMYTLKNVCVSPWHPVFIGGQWHFPADYDGLDVEQTATTECYNMLLEQGCSDHTIQLQGGITTCTLGHGLLGEVVEHEYWGSYECIERDLRLCKGWHSGKINLSLPVNSDVGDLLERDESGVVRQMHCAKFESESFREYDFETDMGSPQFLLSQL